MRNDMPDIATTRPTRWLQARIDQRTGDLLIAIAVTVFAFVAIFVGFGGDITPTFRAGVVIVIAGAAIAARRKWPLPGSQSPSAPEYSSPGTWGRSWR
jgi:hypothetical protein